MKKFILYIILYGIYFASIPAFFFSNNTEISESRILHILSKILPKSWITDKLFHFGYFFASVIFLYLIHLIFDKRHNKKTLLFIFFFLLTTIIAIEYIQPYFGRNFEFLDIIYGTLGMSLATNLIFFIKKPNRKKWFS